MFAQWRHHVDWYLTLDYWAEQIDWRSTLYDMWVGLYECMLNNQRAFLSYLQTLSTAKAFCCRLHTMITCSDKEWPNFTISPSPASGKCSLLPVPAVVDDHWWLSWSTCDQCSQTLWRNQVDFHCGRIYTSPRTFVVDPTSPLSDLYWIIGTEHSLRHPLSSVACFNQFPPLDSSASVTPATEHCTDSDFVKFVESCRQQYRKLMYAVQSCSSFT